MRQDFAVFVLAVRLNVRRGALCAVFGIAMWVALSKSGVAPIVVGRVVLDIHTMLYAAGSMIVGLQIVLFAVFVKAAGVAHGLLPPSRAFGSFIARFTLERGAVVGALLMLAGFVLAAWSLSLWMSAGLADIDPRRVMRLVIPSLTLTIS